jgi:hypothetical protein
MARVIISRREKHANLVKKICYIFVQCKTIFTTLFRFTTIFSFLSFSRFSPPSSSSINCDLHKKNFFSGGEQSLFKYFLSLLPSSSSLFFTMKNSAFECNFHDAFGFGCYGNQRLRDGVTMRSLFLFVREVK